MLPIRHFCCYSDFSRQMSNIWSGPMSRERLHIQIWYRTKFYRTVVLAHEQVPLWSGPNYRLHNLIWSGPWSDKDLVWTKLVLLTAPICPRCRKVLARQFWLGSSRAAGAFIPDRFYLKQYIKCHFVRYWEPDWLFRFTIVFQLNNGKIFGAA